MRRPWIVGLIAALAGCGADEPAPRPAAPDACTAPVAAFVARAIPFVQGRAPRGSREVRIWSDAIRILDGTGRDGRRMVARALAEGADYRRRWSTVLQEHLAVPRSGRKVQPVCWGLPNPAAADAELAAFVRDHGPQAQYGEPFNMADLVASALRLDDVSPPLVAHVIWRMRATIEGANVGAEELEWARRVDFGRAFEATYLGRRQDCLPCHNGEGSVTDAVDPAEDRFWPVVPGLERAVFGAPGGMDPDRLHAAFRWEGFARGSTPAWGSEACGGYAFEHAGDLLGREAYLAGPLPAGAHAGDVARRLGAGFRALSVTAPDVDTSDPAAAFAYLVSMNVVETVWRQASGHPLTVAHGFSRNAAQRDILAGLTSTFVAGDRSMRDLVVDVVTHPALDRAAPADCADEEGAASGPAVFDPFDEVGTNGPGHVVHRYDPWLALDRACTALGWALPLRFPVPYALADPPFLEAIGAHMEDGRPGHDGVDVVGLLAWEEKFAAGEDPGFFGEGGGDADWIDALLDTARATPDATVVDLVMALEDRLLLHAALDARGRAAVEALIGMPLETPVAAAGDGLASGIRHFAGALLATPQFLMAGLATPVPDPVPPRLIPPEDRTGALCDAILPRLPAGLPWRCGPEGLGLSPGSDRSPPARSTAANTR